MKMVDLKILRKNTTITNNITTIFKKPSIRLESHTGFSFIIV